MWGPRWLAAAVLAIFVIMSGPAGAQVFRPRTSKGPIKPAPKSATKPTKDPASPAVQAQPKKAAAARKLAKKATPKKATSKKKASKDEIVIADDDEEDDDVVVSDDD